MITQLYPPELGTWTYWKNFAEYCFKDEGFKRDHLYEPKIFFDIAGKELSNFNGKIIWPNKDPNSLWSMDHLEFNTEEDLLIFKLKFN